MIELSVQIKESGWIFFAYKDGECLAEMVANRYGDSVLVHNKVMKWNRSLYSAYKEMFEDIRGYLRYHGIKMIIPFSDKYTEKLGKYWKMFGFECFAECEKNGIKIHLAVMEA